MTERLYLHVGAPKSGTTYLQSVLRHNRRLLADAGVLVVGDRHVDLVRAGLVVREDPRARKLPDGGRRLWRDLVEQVRSWPGGAAVLSYELLSAATAEQATRVREAFPGIEVHLVVTARDFARALPSAWQERLKFGLTTPLEEWRPRREEDGPRAEWGWRTMDPSGVIERWGAGLPPEQVHLVTVPHRADDPAELWHRFARACGLDAVAGLDLTVSTPNESLGPVAAELLRRVNGHVGAPIRGSREQARWLRDTLAHRVLVPLEAGGLGLTDEQFDEASARADAAIEALRGRGYDVRGDLEDLRAERPSGRTPGAVTDTELVDLAARALARMLLMVRRRSHAARGESAAAGEPLPPARGVAGRARRLARVTLERGGAARVQAELERMTARVAELEAQVQRGRVLHRRVAELDDLVSELLVPAREQNGELLAKALRDYSRESL